MAKIAIIVAMTNDRLIGRSGGLPWRLSADLRRFKKITLGHTIVMGRRTFESIGRALPGRQSIVITRQPDWAVPTGLLVAHSLDEAIAQSTLPNPVFIIGGGELYGIAMPLATALHVTWVQANLQGDTYFPRWNESDWQLLHEESLPADHDNEFAHRYCEYERIPS